MSGPKYVRMYRDPLIIISLVLLIIGGLNLLVMAFGVNVIEAVFGPVAISILTKLVYICIGLGAIYVLYPLYLIATADSA
jgi:uncharacterized membrane protein YuzA (DUF378 family)